MNKHRTPVGLGLALGLALAGPAGAQGITTVKIAEGIDNPTFLTSPPGETNRLFVCSKRKGIYIVKNGVVLPDMFLDLIDETGQFTQGVMSMAFHPNYAVNGKFYVVYSNTVVESQLVEYEVSATNPDLADESTARFVVGPVLQPDPVHNFDLVTFGPDGMLYLSTGDGGGLFNQFGGTAQDLGSILGKVLRLDMSLPPPHIPPDNPFVGLPGAREEIWLYGLRQPWRYAWDSVTGDFFLADVGEDRWEELNVLTGGPAPGANFGWVCMEGDSCTNQGTCTCFDTNLVDPVYEYPHSQGCAIIGGFVYRGNQIPTLQGTYFFADFCLSQIFSFRWDGANMLDFQDRTAELAPSDGSGISLISSFGMDSSGELYIMDTLDHEIFKVIDDTCAIDNYCQAGPNSVGAGMLIAGLGSPSLMANDLWLTAAGGPLGNQFGVFFYSPAQTMVPFGNGFLCVSTPLHRLNPPVVIQSSGTAVRPVNYTLPPMDSGEGQVLAGSSWNFQFWYRDPAGGGAGYNLSDGLHVSFCP